MNTIAARPLPNAAPLWDKAAFPINDSTKHLAPKLLTVSQVQPEDFAKPSAWSISPLRRCLDFVLAIFALLICWPLLVFSALLVRIESPGPVIFRQRRVGFGGRLFTVYKFRTMTDPVGQHDGPSMTKRGDPRITRVGRLLRQHKLDELPQLFNVLRGDMSLVGPRPRLPHHVDEMDLPVRPGLTGAATLVFRCEEEMLQSIPDHELEFYNCRMIIPLKAKLDWDYMCTATFASDFTLLCKTAVCCLASSAQSIFG